MSQEKQDWIKVSTELPCPVCGESDWCLVSNDDPYNPRAVVCARTAKGKIQILRK